LSRLVAASTPLAARLLVAALFLYSGWSKLAHPAGAAGRIVARGLPLATAGAVTAGVLEVLAGAAIVVGFRARAAALALVPYVLVVSWLFHWRAAVAGDAAQLVQLAKNGAVVGALLLLAAHGPGSASLDRG
jgi:putative oxidoreductase